MELKFNDALNTRLYSSAVIQPDTTIHCTDNSGGENTFEIEGQQTPIQVTSIFPPLAGDRIIRRPNGTFAVLRQGDYQKVFQDVPEELEIEVSEDNRRVRAYFNRDFNILNRTRIAEISKEGDSWIMGWIEDVSGYDMVSALNILAAIEMAVRKVKEIDPDGWMVV